jgi:hypothetical protein
MGASAWVLFLSKTATVLGGTIGRGTAGDPVLAAAGHSRCLASALQSEGEAFHVQLQVSDAEFQTRVDDVLWHEPERDHSPQKSQTCLRRK